MSMKFLIGTDPELFVKDGDRFVSAHDLIPGTKESPYLIRGGAVQVDGVAAEFNTNPAESEDEFISNIGIVMERLEEMVKDGNASYHIVAEPVATFSEEYFETLPPLAKMLGCSPDWNAYTGKQNTPPETDEPFRTGSFHVHIGWTSDEDCFDDEYIKLCCEVVKQIDAVIYPASHLWDQDMKRRTLYGARGAFRPKSYGLEYRPLSNAVLRDFDQDGKTARFVYRQVVGAVDLFFNKNLRVYE